ncbi:MAG: WxcM-like domain-containing protein [Prevotella sp.]|nr:WxcM-like domain-containing protein [Prevotella sp.]
MRRELGRLIELPKIIDPRGNLTVAEQLREIPFNVERVYWTYDVPAGESRGGHAHRECEEVIVAVSGSFDVTLNNGEERKTYHLNHPYQGLYVGTGIWRTLDDFSSGAVCLVIASHLFEEEDYIRDYDEYQRWATQSK